MQGLLFSYALNHTSLLPPSNVEPHATSGEMIRTVLNDYLNDKSDSLASDYLLIGWDYDYENLDSNGNKINPGASQLAATQIHPGTNIYNYEFVENEAKRIINLGYPVIIGTVIILTV